MQVRTARQERLLEVLQATDGPVSGTDLARMCGVTRQVVVHDMALLRASGLNILSTPRGYILQSTGSEKQQRTVLSVCHGPEHTAFELYTLVDCGISVIDVIVEHPLYGELRGALHLKSRRDVNLFRNQVQTTGALLLSSLTDGHHLHTVEYSDSEGLYLAMRLLRENGIKVYED